MCSSFHIPTSQALAVTTCLPSQCESSCSLYQIIISFFLLFSSLVLFQHTLVKHLPNNHSKYLNLYSPCTCSNCLVGPKIDHTNAYNLRQRKHVSCFHPTSTKNLIRCFVAMAVCIPFLKTILTSKNKSNLILFFQSHYLIIMAIHEK